jgi:proteasome lid subunit RPN8/RPN11
LDAVVSEFYELSNIDASGEHYSMNPEEQFAAVKDMRIKGLRMLAIWHSHPETPARMSDEDLRLAYTPGVAYVIVSLAQVDKPSVRGFVVKDGSPEEVEVRIVPDSSSTDQ